jgi:signal transduction histidine kinase
MPGLSYFLALLLALGGLSYGWVARRRLAAAQAAAAAARGRAASLSRSLGLLAEELHGPGLSLLGLAGSLPPDLAAALRLEADRLLRLTDEAKEMLAAEAGPRSLQEAPVPLAPLLREVIAVVSLQLGVGRRQWRLAPDFEDMALRADARALRGALQQVLARAARLTRDGDWIDLRPVTTTECLAIVVEDEGAGLRAEDLAAGAAEAEHTRGLSFGLAVARSLLEAHGGGLRLEAQPGIGARAWMTLPRARLLGA